MADRDDFYRQRDALNGGTDSPWVEAGTFNQWHQALADSQNSTVPDMRADDDNRFSGVLSQSDLAG